MRSPKSCDSLPHNLALNEKQTIQTDVEKHNRTKRKYNATDKLQLKQSHGMQSISACSSQPTANWYPCKRVKSAASNPKCEKYSLPAHTHTQQQNKSNFNLQLIKLTKILRHVKLMQTLGSTRAKRRRSQPKYRKQIDMEKTKLLIELAGVSSSDNKKKRMLTICKREMYNNHRQSSRLHKNTAVCAKKHFYQKRICTAPTKYQLHFAREYPMKTQVFFSFSHRLHILFNFCCILL